ncbi:PREDICTED: uncharacterized protein LOC109337132 [Lupinus angustifolius]|uniref:uncharacterized protein LOC109337132 n=1 Tax=Lupinus angustifolius TaxID=3871 RepID=UPI00092E27C0|nr:PREDICTED: uncharacterized protein LOC109337132 [Lupinus angustifolius]
MATYQRAMVTLFHDMLHKEIEVYVDDIICKSKVEEEHVVNLRKLFERLGKYSLKLNPTKCSFGVKSGRVLGFIVSQKGIEVDPEKLTATCEPIFKLLRKNQPVKWNDDCQRAFESIKQYLTSPPILMPPVPGRPLLMYLTVLDDFMGCVLAQHDESGRKEQAVYYLSKKFTDCETRYSLLERTCCALVWASRRLRQYMLSHTTWLISKMDPIKYIFEKPILTGRIARWQVLLSEYDIMYVTQGSVLADYLVNQPIERHGSMHQEFPGENIMNLSSRKSIEEEVWTLVFDGASNALGHGVGVVLVSPENNFTPIIARLCFDCTNNIAEYEACVLGLQETLERKVKLIEVFGDSALVIHQVKGEWETRDGKLVPYKEYIQKMMEQFEQIRFYHIPRDDNRLADALSTLASMFHINGDDQPLIRIKTRDQPAYCCAIETSGDGKPWYHDIKKYVQRKEYPREASETDKRTLRRLATSFFLDGNILYKRNHDMVLLRCVEEKEAEMILKDVYKGSFGTHANGHAVARKILRAGYFWLTMETDCCAYVRKCHKCQICADNINAPSNPLNVLSAPWPFSIVTRKVVLRFVKKELVCIYGLPSKIITDNATNLNNKMMTEMCNEFKIKHHTSSPYRPKMNGAVEAANKNIKKIIQKMVVLPVEVEIPSLRIMAESGLEESEWVQARYDQLNMIDGKRLAAICHGQLYQKRPMRAFAKKVRPRYFREGGLVLKKILPIQKDRRGKWTPNYEGPFVVKNAFSGGALILTTMDGNDLPLSVNSDAVKKYYA